MSPDVSIIIVSHNKPRVVKQAVQSVLDQTHPSWQGFLVDSGVLLDRGFFDDLRDPRMKVTPSGETPETAATKNMASWCFNRVLDSGEVAGELIMYLCDDDLLYPEAFATYWDFYERHHRDPQAMYASQDIGIVKNGTTKVTGRRIAARPAGSFCNGEPLDLRVDYLQFCHTARILDKARDIYKTELHPEDKCHASHADGLFMERIGALTTVHCIDKVLSMNRRTMESTNIEYPMSAIARKWKGLRRRSRAAWDHISAQWARR